MANLTDIIVLRIQYNGEAVYGLREVGYEMHETYFVKEELNIIDINLPECASLHNTLKFGWIIKKRKDPKWSWWKRIIMWWEWRKRDRYYLKRANYRTTTLQRWVKCGK